MGIQNHIITAWYFRESFTHMNEHMKPKCLFYEHRIKRWFQNYSSLRHFFYFIFFFLASGNVIARRFTFWFSCFISDKHLRMQSSTKKDILVRLPKLSSVEPCQYLDGWSLGNTGYCKQHSKIRNKFPLSITHEVSMSHKKNHSINRMLYYITLITLNVGCILYRW